MAKTKKKFKKRLFMVQRELNVSLDTLEEYLEEEGYGSVLKGKGLNAKITDEGAYLDLLEAFADDQETRQRVKEMRENRESDGSEDGEVPVQEEEAPAEAEEVEEVPAAEEEEVVAEEEEEAAAPPAPSEEEAGVAAEEAEKPEPAPVEEKEEDQEAEEDLAPAEAEVEEVPAAEEEEAVAEEEEEAAPVEAQAQEEVETETPQVDAAQAREEAEVQDGEAEPEDQVAEAEAKAEAEETEEDEEEEAEDPASDTLKANRYNLPGTNVVGKIDIGSIKEKARERRKKRKRKRKEKARKKKQKKEKKQKKKQAKKKPKLEEEDIEEQMQKTLNELEQGVSRIRQRRRRRRRERHEEERERARERRMEAENTLNITEYVSTGELANLMDVDVNDIIGTLMEAGRMVSINQRLDAETIRYVAEEYDYDVEFIDEFDPEDLQLEEDNPEDLQPRAPVVTVMGHVDHGKTSLLDYVRATNVVAGEAGGITQHIGAYRVQLPSGRDITFLDTPGHEAFTAMRARGAKATDLVILVVAADDSVMPQTVEAINHAQAAEVPIVVAINKMDLPEANPQRVMQELTEHNILVEPYGGQVQTSEISAKTGEGMEDLLEKVQLEADLLELKANPERHANGIIVESRLERGRGNVATVLVQNGSLRVGDSFVAGIHSGRVRAMFDERDNPIEEVGPSQPALILGFNGSPDVGDQFVVLEEEAEARDIAQRRQQIHREQALRQKKHITLDEIGRRLAIGEFHELNLILKADVGGSVGALADALMKLKTEEVAVNVIHTGVGAITENDVMLASASDAVIIGFQVRPRVGARKLAETEEIDIRTYSVIYEAVEDVHLALEGLLSPERSEETVGVAEVRETFKVPSIGTVAGAYVTDGRINRNDKVRLVRDGVVITDGTISSLKRFKDDVREVQTGYEFGIGIENYDDIKVGDEIEAYKVVETRRTLEV